MSLLNLSNIKNVSGVYAIVNTATGLVYVGSALKLRWRLGVHANGVKRKNHGNWKIRRDAVRHGADCFQVIILETCDQAVIREREQHWIDLLRATDGYNIVKTAVVNDQATLEKLRRSHRGLKQSKETVEKRKASLTGQKRSGIPLANIIASNQSPAVREKNRLGQLGRKHREETKAKISLSKLGIKRTDAARTAMKAGWARRRERLAQQKDQE